LERLDQLDKEADETVGESVVPWEDIVEIALKEFHKESHNAALDLVDVAVAAAGNDHADYDPDRDGRPMATAIRGAIKHLMIP